MSDVAADVAADVVAFLAADTTDVLAADTTDVLSAAKAADGGFCPAIKNEVLRLIWPAMAPNRVKTGPSGAKSDFLSIGRAEIQQGCQRWAEKIWDLGRVGSGPGGLFGCFPEWPEMALGLLFGPWGALGVLFGGLWGMFGVPPWLILGIVPF